MKLSKKGLQKNFRKKFIFPILAILLAISVIAAATIWTDKSDYDPGETVLISGQGFIPNTEIYMGIVRPDEVSETFIINSTSSGTFVNATYELTPERAMDGTYDICSTDGDIIECTSFTDCSSCSSSITTSCSESDTVKVKGYYGCSKRLKIKVYDNNDNLVCENEMPVGTYGKKIYCDTGLSSLNGYAKLYKRICLWGCQWWLIKTKSISEECQQEPVCGNDVIEDGEQCDDGNTNNGDGCSSQCTLEENCAYNPQCEPELDNNFEFQIVSKVDNCDGTYTYRFKVRNINDNALSYIAIGLPSGVVPSWPTDSSVYTGKYKTYNVENPTNNPFYSIKYNTIGEGIKNSDYDIFEFTVDQELSLPIPIKAKAGCRSGYETLDCILIDCDCEPGCIDNDQDGYDIYDPVYCPQGNDCDDDNPDVNPGATEICNNQIDDDCDNYLDCSDSDCIEEPLCGDCITISKPPDHAEIHDSTDVTSKVAYSDDIRASQIGESTYRYIYFDWDFTIPAGSTIESSIFTLEHNENQVEIKLEWFNGASWQTVCELPEFYYYDYVSYCDLSSYIDTVSEADYVQLRIKITKTGACHEYVDWALLNITYCRQCIDTDGDGYGNPGDASCQGGPETDCDDTNSSIYPGAPELCNQLDDDCDTLIDEDFDDDGCIYSCQDDGYTWTGNGGDLNCCGDDMNENNPYQSPETSCSDNNDNDCDGDIDCNDNDCTDDPDCIECTDQDQDGFNMTGGECGPIDCNDTNPNIYPGVPEDCDNGLDDDCDDLIDCNDPDCTDSPACYELDFGDAPDPLYPTLSASNGARHVMIPGFFLGATIDPEPDGQPDPNALGDDNNGIPDDEEGVVFNTPLTICQTATITVTVSAPGFLDAWIDLNSDGDWNDPGEQIFVSIPLVPGPNILQFNVPCPATATNTFSRFRFSSVGGLAPFGFAPDGEVEDYFVEIETPCIDADGDGYDACDENGQPIPDCDDPCDCDDTDPNVHPGAEEICDDGIDNDCDGLIDRYDLDCRICISLTGPPDYAYTYNGTDVTEEVNVSDDIYATQEGNSTPTYIYMYWNFSDEFPYDDIVGAVLVFEHSEDNVTIEVEWLTNNMWLPACDPEEYPEENISRCDLSYLIHTLAEANEITLRFKVIEIGGSTEYIDWAIMNVTCCEGTNICDNNTPPILNFIRPLPHFLLTDELIINWTWSDPDDYPEDSDVYLFYTLDNIDWYFITAVDADSGLAAAGQGQYVWNTSFIFDMDPIPDSMRILGVIFDGCDVGLGDPLSSIVDQAEEGDPTDPYDIVSGGPVPEFSTIGIIAIIMVIVSLFIFQKIRKSKKSKPKKTKVRVRRRRSR